MNRKTVFGLSILAFCFILFIIFMKNPAVRNTLSFDSNEAAPSDSEYDTDKPLPEYDQSEMTRPPEEIRGKGLEFAGKLPKKYPENRKSHSSGSETFEEGQWRERPL